VTNSDGYIGNFTSTYSELGLRQSKLWNKGTLCITIAANIGKTGILTFDACFPDSVVGFAPGNGLRTEFVQQWFAFVQPALERDAPQFAQKNINLAILRELTLINPPFDLQHCFADRVAEIDKLKAHHNAAKHGVTFQEAMTVFVDPLARTIPDPDHSADEERWVTVGEAFTGNLLVVVHTWREMDPHRTDVRIISARRPTRSEARQYREEEMP
jgi:uncharacterized DUF497 family protein